MNDNEFDIIKIKVLISDIVGDYLADDYSESLELQVIDALNRRFNRVRFDLNICNFEIAPEVEHHDSLSINISIRPFSSIEGFIFVVTIKDNQVVVAVVNHCDKNLNVNMSDAPVNVEGVCPCCSGKLKGVKPSKSGRIFLDNGRELVEPMFLRQGDNQIVTVKNRYADSHMAIVAIKWGVKTDKAPGLLNFREIDEKRS